jgi:hypothetical protein
MNALRPGPAAMARSLGAANVTQSGVIANATGTVLMSTTIWPART